MLSGTDVVGAPSGFSWIHGFAALSAAFLYADPFHRIWPRRRVTIADLPRLQGELPGDVPEGLRETVRAR